jgi:hypothetical protein
VVLAGFGGEEEVGTALIGSDPRAIQSHFRESTPGALRFPDVLDHIDQSLVGIGLRDGMLGRILSGVEFDVLGAAGGFGGGYGSLVLRKCGNSEKD